MMSLLQIRLTLVCTTLCYTEVAAEVWRAALVQRQRTYSHSQ